MKGARWSRAPTITLVCGVIALGLGVWGYCKSLASDTTSWNDWLEAFLASVQLFTLGAPEERPENWQFLLARLAAVAAVAVGVAGLVGHVVPQWWLSLRIQWLGAKARLRSLLREGGPARRFYDRRHPPHVVVCGLGRIGIQLVRDLRAPGRGGPRTPVVVLEREPANPRITTARDLGALVLPGDARDAYLLDRARLRDAAELFVVSGDDSENVDIVIEARRYLQTRAPARPLRCYVNLIGPKLAEACRSNDVFHDESGNLRTEIFNVIENSARLLIAERIGVAHAPRPDQVAHYVLLGFGVVGQILAREAAKLAHFGNRKRLRMTIIDDFEGEPSVRRARERFLAQHPGFCPDPAFDLAVHADLPLPEKDDWSYAGARPAEPGWQTKEISADAVEYAVNAEFREIGRDVAAPELIELLRRRLSRPDVRGCVIVCFDDDRRNFEAACKLLPQLRAIDGALPLYAYLPQEGGLVQLLCDREEHSRVLAGMQAFGAFEESASHSRVTRPHARQIARAFHEVYQQAAYAGVGEAQRAAWDALDPTWRQSNEEAAAHLDIKLTAVGCARASPGREGSRVESLPNVELLVEMEHNRWMAERLVGGWRYGPRSDVERTRESIVPWAVMDKRRSGEEMQKDADQIRAIVPAIERAGDAVVALSGQTTGKEGADTHRGERTAAP